MYGKVFGFLCLLFVASPALADDWDRASAAYDEGRYEDAIALMTPLAEGGLVQAQSTLAHIHGYGHGTPINEAAAYSWMRRAAEQGDAGAQSKLGQMYLIGAGVKKDEAQAVHWLELAANQYDPAALYNLATMTMEGIGTKADPTAAINLYYAASTLDESNSIFALGMVYLTGKHEPADIDLGLQFLSWSAQLGNRRASAMLAIVLQEIPEVEHHLVKSAAQFQVAMARGCDDLDKEAALAMSLLSPQERALYDRSMTEDLFEVNHELHDHVPERAHCLSQ